MHLERRAFLTLAAGGAAWATLLASPLARVALAAQRLASIKAVAFDAFPIFDPRAAFRVIRTHYPEHGDALQKAWFNTMFSYTWLRTSGGQYKDFQHVMEDALRFSAASMQLELTQAKQESIMKAFLHLPVWPDVKPVLDTLRSRDVRLAFLSNMTEAMLRANMQHNGIEGYFEHVLSTDRAQAFKPAASAYQLGVDAFGLRKEEIVFAAFAGWDAAGASWFGYPTVWINRLDAMPEKLDATLVAEGRDLSALTEMLHERDRRVPK